MFTQPAQHYYRTSNIVCIRVQSIRQYIPVRITRDSRYIIFLNEGLALLGILN